MKQQNYTWLLLLTCITLASSCAKNISGYSDEPRVYFFERNTDATQSRLSNKSFTFLLQPLNVTKDTFLIRVKIMGNTAPVNRIVRGRTINSPTNTAIEGQHYEFIDGIVPADSIYGYLPVVLKRTEDIKTKEIALLLGIADTKDFKRGVGEDSAFTLSWSDNVVKPANWDAFIGLSTYFGTYSATKWRFIISVTGKDNFPLQQSGRVPPAPGEYTASGMADLKAILKAALQAYNATHTPPLTDENGQLVTFPQ